MSWDELESVLSVKSGVWRGRYAKSLGDSNDERALRILLVLLKAEEESVVVNAIESMESIFLAGYIFYRAQVIFALNDDLESGCLTLKLMKATLAKKLRMV